MGKIDWKSARAPCLDEIETIAREAYTRLPEAFQAACKDVVFHVTEFPDDDVIAEMELESPFDVLGLFTGAGLPMMGTGPETGQMPNTIHLYRRPILDYWAEHDETLEHLVAHVLIHEIGHQLGLSDEQLEAIEAQG
ncbi:MAG: metallopeptidase family protein [Bosea sp. (in: a-proteobacteria)]